MRAYALDDAGFDQLLAAQGGACAICAVSFEPRIDGFMGKSKRPHVDHDHATGAVRGLLCHHCNVLIGHATDSPDVLRKAIGYLER